MKLKPKESLTLALITLLFSVACLKKSQEKNSGVPASVNVSLPGEVANAESDPSVLKESAVIISVPAEDEYYIGDTRFHLEDLQHQIGKLLKDGQIEAPVGTSAPARIVYLAGGINVSHGAIVNVLHEIRTRKVTHLGLLVKPKSGSVEAPAILRVQVSAELDPNEDIGKLKPNPLMLVVSIASDGGLKLNQEPMGSTVDTTTLSQSLKRVFQLRKEQHAYRQGAESRSDLPEDERVEKTIHIKADNPIAYAEVIRAIDAVKGAGANPIVVQLEGFPRLSPISTRLRSRSLLNETNSRLIR